MDPSTLFPCVASPRTMRHSKEKSEAIDQEIAYPRLLVKQPTGAVHVGGRSGFLRTDPYKVLNADWEQIRG